MEMVPELCIIKNNMKLNTKLLTFLTLNSIDAAIRQGSKEQHLLQPLPSEVPPSS